MGKEGVRKDEDMQDIVMGCVETGVCPILPPESGSPETATVEPTIRSASPALVQRPSFSSWRKEALSKDQGKEAQVCMEDLIDVAGHRQHVCSYLLMENYGDIFPTWRR